MGRHKELSNPKCTVFQVEGAEWQRHRKVTAPPFNERNSALVWHESWRQADQMLDVWTEGERPTVSSVSRDAARLALNNITCAGFGLSYQFRNVTDDLQGGHTMSYGASLMAVMGNIPLLVLVPSWVFGLPILPPKMVKFRAASSLRDTWSIWLTSQNREQPKGRLNTQTSSTLWFKSRRH